MCVFLHHYGAIVTSGFLSTDKLTLAGLSTTVTFGEMVVADLVESCDEVDGLLGMGLSNEDGQNAFEDMLDVRLVVAITVWLSISTSSFPRSYDLRLATNENVHPPAAVLLCFLGIWQ